MVVIFRDARNLVISEHRMRRGVMRQNVTGLEPYILSRFEVSWDVRPSCRGTYAPVHPPRETDKTPMGGAGWRCRLACCAPSRNALPAVRRCASDSSQSCENEWGSLSVYCFPLAGKCSTRCRHTVDVESPRKLCHCLRSRPGHFLLFACQVLVTISS